MKSSTLCIEVLKLGDKRTIKDYQRMQTLNLKYIPKTFYKYFLSFCVPAKVFLFWIPCIIYFPKVLFHHITTKKRNKSWKKEGKCFVTDGFAEFQWERTFYRRLAKVKHIHLTMDLLRNMCVKSLILILFYYNGSYNWNKKL